MDKVLNMQLSYFGSFADIKLNTELVIKLLSALRDDNFVPGSVEIASVDIRTGKMIVDTRMQMMSPDKTWTIVFLPERIDFNYVYQNETTIQKSIDKLLENAVGIIRKVFSVLEMRLGNRLAFNCRFALESMTKDDLKQFCDRFTKPLAAYSGQNYAEWTVRFNSRGFFKISESEKEECNRIVEMTQVEDPVSVDNTSAKHSMIIMMDMNTLALKLEQRFKYDNLIFFSNDVAKFISELTEEIEG